MIEPRVKERVNNMSASITSCTIMRIPDKVAAINYKTGVINDPISQPHHLYLE